MGPRNHTFTVVYDKLETQCLDPSASVAILKDPTSLEVHIEAGVRAGAWAAIGTDAPVTAGARIPGLYSLAVARRGAGGRQQ